MVLPLPEFKPTNKMQTDTQSPWRTDDPPKDGSIIVALGNATEDCGDGLFNVEPFTDSIKWDGEEWVNLFDLSVRINWNAEITIQRWLPDPRQNAIDDESPPK